MNDTKDDLEIQLRAMFEAQEKALAVPEREWSGGHDMWPLKDRRRPRRPYVAVGIAAGIVILLAAIPVVDRSSAPVKTGQGGPDGRPPAAPGSQFHVETTEVSLTAGVFSIDVEGQSFATANPVQVHGDPGTFHAYTTLELTWLEHGVEMRLNIYFTSDGHQWWSDEIRTYDGRTRGEWITYHGDFFRSPLGMPFVGNLDVTATDHGVTGHLRLLSLSLEAFRRPSPCASPTAPYALASSVGSVDLSLAPPNGGFGLIATLLDTAACAPVAKPDDFTYQWTGANPAIVTVAPTGLEVALTAKAAGMTALHLTAKNKASGAVVAVIDVPVRVSP